MGTRCTTHFYDMGSEKPDAIIFRHWDGYPEVAGKDLMTFLKRVQKLEDTRFFDATILAARYVVFLSEIYRNEDTDPLDFLSVRVEMEDSPDIEYRYVVRCGPFLGANHKLPKVEAYAVNCSYPDNVWTQRRVRIPK